MNRITTKHIGNRDWKYIQKYKHRICSSGPYWPSKRLFCHYYLRWKYNIADSTHNTQEIVGFGVSTDIVRVLIDRCIRCLGNDCNQLVRCIQKISELVFCIWIYNRWIWKSYCWFQDTLLKNTGSRLNCWSIWRCNEGISQKCLVEHRTVQRTRWLVDIWV